MSLKNKYILCLSILAIIVIIKHVNKYITNYNGMILCL